MKIENMTDADINRLIKVQIRAGNWEGARTLAATILQRKEKREAHTQSEGVPSRLLREAA